MKYNVGDRVRIKSLDWYNENKGPFGELCPDFIVFLPSRSKYCGQIMTIKEVLRNSYNSDLIYYKMIEDAQLNDWTNGMIEGLVEEETLIERVDDNGLPFNEWLSHKGAFYIPDGYELKDENGNVINAQKIVLEKKKKEYPKTYEECCKVLGVDSDNFLSIRNLYRDDGEEETTDYERDLLGKFDSLWELKICRDAYWKIAGNEMGLGKPWEPDYKNPNIDLYVIINIYNRVEKAKYGYGFESCVFTFPTPEMRDAFKENFDPDIEFCKEFL